MPKRIETNLDVLTGITVAGFKSLPYWTTIDLKPLTILAGANSSGKSSVVQPLLLFKQSLEATFDPGPLLLNGPNVRFTSARQFLWQGDSKMRRDVVEFGFTLSSNTRVFSRFSESDEPRLKLVSQEVVTSEDKHLTLVADDTSENIARQFAEYLGRTDSEMPDVQWKTRRERCFLDVDTTVINAEWGESDPTEWAARDSFSLFSPLYAIHRCRYLIGRMIHVPGLRGNPRRTYAVTGIGERFPGTFEPYTASVLAHWQREVDEERSAQLNQDLFELGLTSSVEAKPLDEANIELHVGRMLGSTASDTNDTVNIADVGFGVSQTLPVLVALHAALPGQLVYIEQPEIHLHPRAQVAMAAVLARAARRGVRLIVETHSSLMLLALQTLIAENHERLVSSGDVQLHWFTRDEHGATQVSSATIDENGSFGEWPEDFGDVMMEAENRYLTAVESKQWGE